MSAVQMMTIIASIAVLTVLIVLAYKRSESKSEEDYATKKYGANFKIGGFGIPKNWR